MRPVQVYRYEYESSYTTTERIFFRIFTRTEAPADADSRQSRGRRRQEAENIQERRRYDRRQDRHDGMDSDAGERHVCGFCSHRDSTSRDNGPVAKGFAGAYQDGPDAL